MQHSQPFVAIGAMGGTIAMKPSAPNGAVTPGLEAQDLVDAVPGLSDIVELRIDNVCNLPSASIGVPEVLQALDFAREAVRAGAVGVVLTHGTDTLEETAYLLDLLWDEAAPIVITGAMRSATAAGAEGPANLLAAVVTACSPQARGLGVLVCLNDTVHLASRVQKTSSMAVESFESPGFGPIGRLVEGEFRLLWGLVSPRPDALPKPADGTIDVALLESCLGGDGRLVRLAQEAGFQGIVVSGLGVGHVPVAMVDAVSRAIDAGVTVVVGSRSARGGTATNLYGYPGSEADLISRGAIMSGALSPRKARLLLHVLLSAGYARGAIRSRMMLHAST